MDRIEAVVQAFTRAHLRQGALAYDVGANIGHAATFYAGLGARVVAFEPNPRAASALRALALPGVELVPAAVSDQAGTAVFHIDLRGEFHGMASSLMRLSDLPEAEIERIEVPTIRLDDHVARTGQMPDFIKVDVEGYEPQVIAGAMETLRRRRPPLVLEFWRDHWDRYLPMFQALDEIYHIYDPDAGAPILQVGPRQEGLNPITNLVAEPRSMVNRLGRRWGLVRDRLPWRSWMQPG